MGEKDRAGMGDEGPPGVGLERDRGFAVTTLRPQMPLTIIVFLDFHGPGYLMRGV